MNQGCGGVEGFETGIVLPGLDAVSTLARVSERVSEWLG